MNDAVLSKAGQRFTRHAFNRLWRPVGAHIGKDLGRAGELMAEQHRYAVQAVVFGCDNERFTNAIPVKGTVEQRFGGIAIWVLIGPVTLSLEARGDRVIAQGFFDQTFVCQLFVTLHHVANAHSHQQAFFQHCAALFSVTLILLRVLIFAVAEVFVRPRQRHFQLGFIIDFLVNATTQLGHINRLHLHTQPGFKEVMVDDRTGDAH